jgi:sulfur-oxidizing protein SoxB
MLSRREFLEVATATAVVTGLGDGLLHRASAQQKITQGDLLRFTAKGQVTILHTTDWHAQILPVYYREPTHNLGVGEANDQPPHITGKDFLTRYGIKAGSLDAYMLTDQDFASLARVYGKVGGVDRIATLIGAIRAERGADKVLLLDGGDTLQGSYTALNSQGADMIRIINLLGVEAMTGHWEFPYGAERVLHAFGDKDSAGEFKGQFLAGNVRDTEFEEPVFRAWKMFEKGGVRIAVIGQAFPYTPIANPRWMFPKWSFGIREDDVRKYVGEARRAGAELVVLLSHNGFDVDRKLVSRVKGVDICLVGHTHDAVPETTRVGDTLLVSTGSHGKFLSRIDVEVRGGHMVDYVFRLIPVLADAITPDAEMAALVREIRAPHDAFLTTVLARTETLLYRRGNFSGTFDDLVCEAMLEELDAEISLSPGTRWGASLLPGQHITWEDIYNLTALTYPNCYRIKMTGEMLKTVLEDVADNLFNPDPYLQQGGDMVRVGGMVFTIDVDAKMGSRISNMTHIRTGQPVQPSREYIVAGWASVNQGTQGPPIWEVVASHLKRHVVVNATARENVKIMRSYRPTSPN